MSTVMHKNSVHDQGDMGDINTNPVENEVGALPPHKVNAPCCNAHPALLAKPSWTYTLRVVPRRMRCTIASKMIAPTSETRSEPRLKSPWLMVPVPTRGEINHPPISAPTMPTTIFRSVPCCRSVPIMRLASQPRMPPTISHTIRLMMLIGSHSRSNFTTASGEPPFDLGLASGRQ